MKKVFALLVLAVCCVRSWAVDLPVPEELIGSQTVGIVHIHLKAFKFDQVVQTLTDKLGAPPDPKALGDIKTFVDGFKAAGGQGISLLINADKNADPATAGDGVVILVTKSDEADEAKLKEICSAFMQGMGVKAAPDCPQEIGGSLAWHSPKYKKPKVNEDKAQAFSDAYTHLSKDASVSVVFVPDEDAVELAEKQMKDAKPEDVKMAKAMLGATGICLFTDFGVAADPALKVLILAADADGAVVLDKAATGLLDMAKKDAPPPLQPFLTSLALVQAGANVQLSINIGELVKAVKTMAGAPAEK